MRGIYSATYRISGLAAAKTLAYITAPAASAVEVIDTHVTNESNETNEQVGIQWHKVTNLGTPTATTVTPAKMEAGDQAAASTVKANVTASEPGYAAANTNTYGAQGVPSLMGYHYEPAPDARFIIPPSGTFGLRILNAPTPFDAVVTCVFRELA